MNDFCKQLLIHIEHTHKYIISIYDINIIFNIIIILLISFFFNKDEIRNDVCKQNLSLLDSGKSLAQNQ